MCKHNKKVDSALFVQVTYTQTYKQGGKRRRESAGGGVCVCVCVCRGVVGERRGQERTEEERIEKRLGGGGWTNGRGKREVRGEGGEEVEEEEEGRRGSGGIVE